MLFLQAHYGNKNTIHPRELQRELNELLFEKKKKLALAHSKHPGVYVIIIINTIIAILTPHQYWILFFKQLQQLEDKNN